MTLNTRISTTTYSDLSIVVTQNVGMSLKYDIECRHVNNAIAKNERMSI